MIVKLLKFISTNKATKHRRRAYIIPNLIDIFPDAIGLVLVRSTFISKFLSTMSLIIHPADLIKIDPHRNKIINLKKWIIDELKS